MNFTADLNALNKKEVEDGSADEDFEIDGSTVEDLFKTFEHTMMESR
jgi:hypothetical protein